MAPCLVCGANLPASASSSPLCAPRTVLPSDSRPGRAPSRLRILHSLSPQPAALCPRFCVAGSSLLALARILRPSLTPVPCCEAPAHLSSRLLPPAPAQPSLICRLRPPPTAQQRFLVPFVLRKCPSHSGGFQGAPGMKKTLTAIFYCLPELSTHSLK